MKTNDTVIEPERKEIEVDLSKLGAVNKILAALFCKLIAPIKTVVSGNVFEEAQDSNAAVRPLPTGTCVSGKVKRQCAHYFSVTISELEAETGIAIRVSSYGRNRFKLLHLEQNAENGGYRLISQEDNKTISSVPSAGMYFFRFQVYRMDYALNSAPAAFFKSLQDLHPCEVTQLKAGTHIFAVYGDNFYKKTPYTIEAISVFPFNDKVQELKELEARLLMKREGIQKFEKEFMEAVANFQQVMNRYPLEQKSVDELMKQRENIYASYTVMNDW